mgnify:FL=1
MAERNLVLQLLITAKNQASGILSSLKTQLAALGVAIAGAFSTKEAAVFEVALDRLAARADETGPALDALIVKAKSAAQTLGPQFGFSATEAANGLTALVAAGFSAKEAIDALPGVLALAAMEGISLEQSATLMSDAIAQFGLKAADASSVADILAKAAGAVAATAVDMGEALKYTGSTASQAGLSLTQTAATLDVLAKAGQRGSEAGTGLSSVLAILANPTHAATKALFDLGATSTQLGDVLDFIQTRGLKAADMVGLFGEQGGRVINTLLAQGGTKAIATFANEIERSGKTAEQTAQIMQGNLLGAFNRFWETLKRVGVELASPNLPTYTAALDTLTGALNRFASNEKIKAFQDALYRGFASIGQAIADVGGSIGEFLGAVNWRGISQTAGQAFDTMRAAVERSAVAIQTLIARLTGQFPNAANLAETATRVLSTVWGTLGGAATLLADGLERVAARFAQVTGLFQTGQAEQQKVAAGYDAMTKAQAAHTEASTRAAAAAEAQVSGYRRLYDSLKSFSTQTVPRIFGELADALGTALGAVRDFGNGLSAWAGGALDNVRPALALVVEVVGKLGSALLDVVRVFAPSMEGMSASGKAMGAVLSSVFAGLAGTLSTISFAVLKLTETVLTGWAELGKLAGVISEADAAAVSGRIQRIGDAANTMRALAEKSFTTMANSQNALIAAVTGADQASQAAVATQTDLQNAVQAAAGAAAESAQKITALNAALAEQQKTVDALAAANARGAASDQAYGAAVQELWRLQAALNSEQLNAASAQEKLSAAQQAAGMSATEAAHATADLRQAVQDAGSGMGDFAAQTVNVKDALGGAAGELKRNTADYGELARGQKIAADAAAALANATDATQAATQKGAGAVRNYSIAWASAADAQKQGVDATGRMGAGFYEIKKGGDAATEAVARHAGAVKAMGDSLAAEVVVQQASARAASSSVSAINELRTTYERTQAAYQASEAALAKGEITQQAATQTRNAARDAMNAYNRALEQGVENAKKYTQATEDSAAAALDQAQADVQLAQSKGDVVGAQRKAITLAEQEADWAAKVADAKIAQIAAERADIEAKLAQTQAIQNKTAADIAEINVLQLKLAALGKAAEAANLDAAIKAQQAANARTATDQTEQQTQATEQHTQATEENSQAQQQNIKHTKDTGQAAAGVAAYLQQAREEVDRLSEATRALFEVELAVALKRLAFEGGARAALNATVAFNAGVDASSKTLAHYATELNNANELIDQSKEKLLFASNGFRKWEAAIELATGKAKKGFYEQAIAAEQLRVEVERLGKQGADHVGMLALATRALNEDFGLLDEQTLSGLRGEIERTTAKLREMQDEVVEAQRRLQELDAEIAAESGDTARADRLKLELDRTDQLAEAEQRLQEAKAAGNADAVRAYDEQIRKLQELYDLKQRNLDAEQRQQDAQRNAPPDYGPPRRTSGAGSADAFNAAPAKIFQLNLQGDGRDLKAFTFDDPDDFLSRVTRDRRSAL